MFDIDEEEEDDGFFAKKVAEPKKTVMPNFLDKDSDHEDEFKPKLLSKAAGLPKVGAPKPKKTLFGDDSDDDGGFVKVEEKPKLPEIKKKAADLVPPPLPVIGTKKPAPAKNVPKKTLVFNSDDDSDDDYAKPKPKPMPLPVPKPIPKGKNNLFGDSDDDDKPAPKVIPRKPSAIGKP